MNAAECCPPSLSVTIYNFPIDRSSYYLYYYKLCFYQDSLYTHILAQVCLQDTVLEMKNKFVTMCGDVN